MAAVNCNHDEWQCHKCTLLNNLESIQCILCGEFRKQKPKNKENFGCVIYRTEPFTAQELEEMHTIYARNPSKRFGKYPIILYPSNDINYKRDKSSDIALLSSTKHNKAYITDLISKYDRKFCYGIVVQFHNELLNYYKKIETLPIFAEFKHSIDAQFHYLERNYIQNGHNIIIPSPNTLEMERNIHSYFTDKSSNKQTIFHTLGTRHTQQWFANVIFRIHSTKNRWNGSEKRRLSDANVSKYGFIIDQSQFQCRYRPQFSFYHDAIVN